MPYELQWAPISLIKMEDIQHDVQYSTRSLIGNISYNRCVIRCKIFPNIIGQGIRNDKGNLINSFRINIELRY